MKSQGGLTRVLDVDVFALLVILNVFEKIVCREKTVNQWSRRGRQRKVTNEILISCQL